MLTTGEVSRTVRVTWSLVSGVAVDNCRSSVRDVLLVEGGRYVLFILVVARSEVLSKGTKIAGSAPLQCMDHRCNCVVRHVADSVSISTVDVPCSLLMHCSSLLGRFSVVCLHEHDQLRLLIHESSVAQNVYILSVISRLWGFGTFTPASSNLRTL